MLLKKLLLFFYILDLFIFFLPFLEFFFSIGIIHNCDLKLFDENHENL